MALASSKFYYWDGSQWVQETAVVDLVLNYKVDSPAILTVLISSAVPKESLYPTLRKVKLVEKNTDLDIFLGRIEDAQPVQDQAYGPCLKITANGYMQELKGRYINSDYATAKRSALIGNLIDDYVYAGNLSKDIEGSGTTTTIDTDWSHSEATPLNLIANMAKEDPWTNETWGAVWRWLGSSYTNNTTEANSAGGTPFNFLTTASEYAYLGQNNPFFGAHYDLSTNGSYGALTFEYWNGAWTALTLSTSYNFTADGEFLFNPPSDWESKAFSNTNPHAGSPPDTTARYWIRISAASVTTTAKINQIKCRYGIGYSFRVGNSNVFEYFRRGSKPAGGPSDNGLSIVYQGTIGNQTAKMMHDYSFSESPKETITRVTVRGTDANGDPIEVTEINSDIETELQTRKERLVNTTGKTTTAALQQRAKSLLHSKMGTIIERGAVRIFGYPYYKIGATNYIVEAGDLVRINCSRQSIDTDYMILSIEYREPKNISTIKLIKHTLGWGAEPTAMTQYVEDTKEGQVMSASRVPELVVSNARIGNLDAGKITTGFLNANRIEATSISAVKLSFSAFDKGSDTLDNVGDGWTWKKVYSTDVSAGHIKLTTYTEAEGEWYDKGGVKINASSGIIIYGAGGYAFRTRATEFGADQCYVGTDGKMYAGQGRVILSAAGLIVDSAGGSNMFTLKNGSEIGSIYLEATGALVLTGGYGAPYLEIVDNLLVSGVVCYPSSSYVDLGKASVWWDQFHYHNLNSHCGPLPVISDSVEAIKSIGTKIKKFKITDVEKERLGKRSIERIEKYGEKHSFEEWDMDSFPTELIRQPTQADEDEAEADYQNRLIDAEYLGKDASKVIKNEPTESILVDEVVWTLMRAVKQLSERIENLENK